MERVKPVTNEIYHIYNRGVEGRDVFLNEKDHLRFIHDLFEFNDQSPALEYREVQLRRKNPRKLLVEILVFCLMPNHFHLLLKQKIDSGISEFMRKLKTGYTNYFNKKYQRPGPLFQGKYKFVIVKNETHFAYLPHYIHFNPLDLIMPEWRQGKIRDYRKAASFLKGYRWSSFLDCIGEKNFPSLISRDSILDVCGGAKRYNKNAFAWLRDMQLERIKDVVLEK